MHRKCSFPPPVTGSSELKAYFDIDKQTPSDSGCLKASAHLPVPDPPDRQNISTPTSVWPSLQWCFVAQMSQSSFLEVVMSAGSTSPMLKVAE